MANKGKTQFLVTFVATPEQETRVDELVASHGKWMGDTHYRDGEKALISYNFSKGPELGNPLDPSSDPTGNIRYVLNEIYESPAGIQDHWQQAAESWADLSALLELIGPCDPQTLHCGEIVESLW